VDEGEGRAKPKYLWWAVGVTLFAVFGMLGSCGSTISSVPGASGSAGSQFITQCADINGVNPSATETPTETTTPDTETLTDTPTDNPFSGMPDPSLGPYTDDCVAAINSGAPFEGPPIPTPNTTSTANCALRLATQQERAKVVDGAGDLTGPTGGGFGAAQFARYVVASASYARVTGQCEHLAQTSLPVTEEKLSGESNLQNIQTMVLPDTVAAQRLYGQAVSKSAVSAGDLVFWGYDSDYHPAQVGVALNSTQMIAPSGGAFAVQPLPSGNVAYKRVLAGSSQ
jgi:hypothetical protein